MKNMYYLLVCCEPDPAILSLHTCPLEAQQERARLEYENKIQKTLASLRNHYFEESEYAIFSCPPFYSSGLTLEEEKQKLDDKYREELNEAREERKRNDETRQLKEMFDKEKKREVELEEIKAFIDWWETHQDVFHTFQEEKEQKTLKIIPIIKSYLKHRNDPYVQTWMMDRLILEL